MEPNEEMRAAGYEPLEPYPGTVASQWLARCSICGAERRPSLHDIRKGKRCGHRRVATTPEAAAEEARAAGFEPMELYPGKPRAPWKHRCIECGAERSPALKDIRDGWRCTHTYREIERVTPADEAVAELRAAGYEPEGPYPGKTKSPWKARCTTCGNPRTTTLNQVRSGERCKHHISERVDRSGPEIMRRHRAGQSDRFIAHELGLAIRKVRDVLDDNGVPRTGTAKERQARPLADLPLSGDEIASRYQQGNSLHRIAEDCQVSDMVIRTRLVEAGVEIRPRRGREK